MTDLNYYSPLTTTNTDEQDTLGQLQRTFNAAVRSAQGAGSTMVNSYLSANVSRKACYEE